MNDDLIERVALALFAVGWASGKGGSNWADADQEYWMRSARAAIEAMREPTKLQQYVGNRYVGAHPEDGLAKVMWEGMIDVGLKNHT